MDEDDFEKFNEYYRKNPPEMVIDDLGIDHDIEAPLPAKYIKKECICGIRHKWEEPNTFYLEAIEMGAYVPKYVKICNTCGEMLLLKLYKNSQPSEVPEEAFGI